ncbi:unnamed protein product [Didymodactylos carnosus]|uniref:RING-type domain-containing protein n=1 Tax=Didymodactylos carnosus TaxID=1234261 RepID=A0A814ENY8_9BILA|nr:unnamed protein product [Didymodactylos carnosus]CAF3744967.1 unnamed protein product [Didymodactylos carnosus]
MLYACEVEIHPRRWYHFCRRFATKALARSYAMRLPPSSTLNDVIYRDCEVRLKVLWSNLEQWIPCEAIYFGPGHPKNENHIVFCGQYKSKHGHCHYTSEPVYLNDSWFAWLFHDSKSDKWGEHFETNDCTTNEPSSEMIAEFFKDVENALEHGTIDVCSTFYKLLSDHQLIHLISNPRSDSDRFICYCCLTNENSSSHRTRRQILGKTINHRRIFCSSCLRKLRQLKSKTDDIGYRTRVVPKYDDKCASCATEKRHAAFYPCGHYGFCRACAMKMEVEPAVCPVCRSQIKKVVKILNVQDKFVGMNEPNIELSGEATEGEGDAHSALREDDCV